MKEAGEKEGMVRFGLILVINATRLCGLLVGALDQPRELVKLDVLPHNGALGLVLLVQRHLDNVALDAPAAHLADEVLKLIALLVQPRLEDDALDLAHGLRDGDGDAHAHELLEASHVGDQVGVQVVAVERRPEAGVVGAAQQVVEDVELLHGLAQRRVAGRRVGGRGARERGQDVRGQQGQAEGEVGRGEDGERLDQDVGDSLVAREVRVELVAVGRVGSC